MADTIALQTDIKNWFGGLNASQQAKLRSEYSKYSGNTRGKELDLGVDGVAGSSTRFLAAKMNGKEAAPAAKQEKINDIQLAAFLKQHTGHQMVCQACIKRESGHRAEFEKIINEHGTPAHMQALEQILGKKKAADIAPSKEQEKTFSTLKETGVVESTIEGHYNLNGKHIEFKQVGSKKTNDDGTVESYGFSKRPITRASGKLQPFTKSFGNMIEDGTQKGVGAETQKGDYTLLVTNLAYMKKDKDAVMSCGCTGYAAALSAQAQEQEAPVMPRDGVLSKALNEFRLRAPKFGAPHIETTVKDRSGNETYTFSSSASTVKGGYGFDEHRNTAVQMQRVTHKDGRETVTADVKQYRQEFHSESTQVKKGNKTITETTYEYDGKRDLKGYETRTVTQVNKDTAVTVTQLTEHSRGLFGGWKISSSTRITTTTRQPDGSVVEQVHITGMDGKSPVDIKGTGVSTTSVKTK